MIDRICISPFNEDEKSPATAPGRTTQLEKYNSLTTPSRTWKRENPLDKSQLVKIIKMIDNKSYLWLRRRPPSTPIKHRRLHSKSIKERPIELSEKEQAYYEEAMIQALLSEDLWSYGSRGCTANRKTQFAHERHLSFSRSHSRGSLSSLDHTVDNCKWTRSRSCWWSRLTGIS